MQQKTLVFTLLIAVTLIIAGIVAGLFILKPKGPGPHSRRTGPDTPPVTFNLGVNFDKWDRTTNMAGDFLFTNKNVSHYNNKVFLENGDVLVGPDGKEMLPHPMYVLPPGTKIIAVTDGVVNDIKYQSEHSDYSLVIYPANSSWTIDYDHVTNIKVNKGDKVTAGQVIAEVSLAVGGLKQSNLGFTEIMIFKDSGHGGNNPTACLYNLLDQSVKEELHARILQLVADWEQFKNDKNIYNEGSWQSPGCALNEINEGDTRL